MPIGPIDARLHDLHGQLRFAAALDPDDYAPSRALARGLRDEAGSDGIVYLSVRHRAGQTFAAFWPDVVTIPVQGRHLCYRWNGTRADAWLIYGEDAWRPLA